MSVLEVKQALSKMTKQERREVQLHLIKLRQQTPAWRKATAKSIREMKTGKYTAIDKLEAVYRRG